MEEMAVASGTARGGAENSAQLTAITPPEEEGVAYLAGETAKASAGLCSRTSECAAAVTTKGSES